MGSDLYFFEQLATRKIPRRYRKLPEELPESLRFAHLAPKVAALLASKERAQKPDNEDPFGDGMGKKSLLPDINAAFQNVRNQFDTALSNDEDSQRYLFEETKISAPSILEQLSRIIYFYEDLYKHVPKSLEYQLMSGYQEFTSDITVIPREWQTNEMKQQYAAKQLQEANSEEEASDNDLLTGRSKSRVGYSDRSTSEVGSRMNVKKYGKAKSSLMDISDDAETIVKSESRTGRRSESRMSALGSQNKNYMDVTSMSRVGSRRKGSIESGPSPYRARTREDFYMIGDISPAEVRSTDGKLGLAQWLSMRMVMKTIKEIAQKNAKAAGHRATAQNNPNQMSFINFQLSNTAFDDKGWIQMKGRHEEVDQNAVLEYCVKHLQESMRKIADQRQKEFEQGFDQTVTIRYYGDTKKDTLLKYRKSPLKSGASAVHKGGKPRIPSISDERNEGKKLMEATHIDGSCIIYYPSGRPAVVYSSAGFGRPGYYTIVYEDGLDSKMLACFTPSGRGVCYYDNGVVRFLATEKGGHITETDGKLIRKWKWPQANVKITEPISFQVNAHIVFRCISHSQMSVVFSCQKETARFSLGPAPDADEYKSTEDTLCSWIHAQLSPLQDQLLTAFTFSSKAAKDLMRIFAPKRSKRKGRKVSGSSLSSRSGSASPSARLFSGKQVPVDASSPSQVGATSLTEAVDSSVGVNKASVGQQDDVKPVSQMTGVFDMMKTGKQLDGAVLGRAKSSIAGTSFGMKTEVPVGAKGMNLSGIKKVSSGIKEQSQGDTGRAKSAQAARNMNENSSTAGQSEGEAGKKLPATYDERTGTGLFPSQGGKRFQDLFRRPQSSGSALVDSSTKEQVQVERPKSSMTYTSTEKPTSSLSKNDGLSSFASITKNKLAVERAKAKMGFKQPVVPKQPMGSPSKPKLPIIFEIASKKSGIQKSLHMAMHGFHSAKKSQIELAGGWKKISNLRPWFKKGPPSTAASSSAYEESVPSFVKEAIALKKRKMDYEVYIIAQKLKKKVLKQLAISKKPDEKSKTKSPIKPLEKAVSKDKTLKQVEKSLSKAEETALLEECKAMAMKGMKRVEKGKLDEDIEDSSCDEEEEDEFESEDDVSSYQSKSQSTEIYKLLQDFPDKVTYDIEADKELAKLQRKAKNLVDDWMEHYRLAVGLKSPSLQSVSDTPNYSIAHRNIKSAKLSEHQLTIRRAILGVDDDDSMKKKRVPSAPLGDADDVQIDDDLRRAGSDKLGANGVTFEDAGGDGTLTPSAMTVINRLTDTASRRSARSRASTSARSGSPSRQAPGLSERAPSAMTGNRSFCPLVIRQQYLGYERPQCRCSRHHIPFIMDIELDDFVNTETPEGQLIVIMVVSSFFPGITKAEEMLGEIYVNQNRNRTRPCIQSRSDMFRVFKYDINTAAEMSDHTQPLLLTRHNVVPGMFLMYCDGKLLFCDHIFNGYGNARKDFKKQIMKSRHDSIQGFALPKDFRFSPSRGKSGLRSAWGGEIGGAGVDKYSSSGTVVDATLVPIHRPISSSDSSENSRDIRVDPVKETVDLGPFHKEIQVRLKPLMVGYKLPSKRPGNRRPFLPHLESSQVPSGGPLPQHESVHDWLATSHPGSATAAGGAPNRNFSSMYPTSMSTTF